MSSEREVRVYLLPELAVPDQLRGSLAVAMDVLRASTTICHALAAGCTAVRPCAEVVEAVTLAGELRAGRVLLGGERGGKPIPGFDLGNSPGEYTSKRCRGMTLVFTTSHGTKAMIRAAHADRALVAGFVNFSAVCEQLSQDQRPVSLICAGTDGEPALEDTILAGAFVDFLCDASEMHLNDSARLAWDCFEHHGQALDGALEIGKGGTRLRDLGYEQDIRSAARVDQFNLVPEVRGDPIRIEVGAIGIGKSRWPS
jgi:2-phosphosulfolactate phosphatase